MDSTPEGSGPSRFRTLAVDAKAAKPVKDLLKKLCWLDQERRVETVPNGETGTTTCYFPLLATCDHAEIKKLRESDGRLAMTW